MELEAVLASGRAYLLVHQDADGLWRDFVTLAGESSDWVSGYVAHCAASVLLEHTAGDGLADAVSRAARALVRRQRPNGGWSYNSTVPTDADSTAWVLLALLDQPEWRPSSTLRARRYLSSHHLADVGGFTTYALADAVHRFIAAPEELTLGWRTPQPCVTAAAIRALLASGAGTSQTTAGCDFLRSCQGTDGLWRSYWWAGPGYPTYQALCALTSARTLDEPTRRAVEGGLDELLGSADTFDVAVAVHTAALLGRATTALDAVRRLVAAQSDDGSWSSEPILRIPPPHIADPADVADWRVDQPGTGVLVSDTAHLFTTATSLAALSAFRAQRAGA